MSIDVLVHLFQVNNVTTILIVSMLSFSRAMLMFLSLLNARKLKLFFSHKESRVSICNKHFFLALQCRHLPLLIFA